MRVPLLSRHGAGGKQADALTEQSLGAWALFALTITFGNRGAQLLEILQPRDIGGLERVLTFAVEPFLCLVELGDKSLLSLRLNKFGVRALQFRSCIVYVFLEGVHLLLRIENELV